ncbi:GDSL-type esterase/lipase family protein [Prevotella bivia]|uniref:GDSL-type esterase/lipase family protein n=1 Tax=Prevotella bivia TaxID=28125 RepID=UPI00254F6EF2|nr:GDSL-type esterase/lipase family protein [Prevotella bivia]MDZ3816841.1 GDSL-type esterase/lipase family protein [Prevotella bivia]
MKSNIHKPLLLTCLVVIILVLLHFLPTIKIAGTELRKIDILSDLIHKEKTSTSAIITSSNSVMKITTGDGRKINFKEEWGKGVEPITDYGTNTGNSLDDFYANLTKLAAHEAVGHPVRIAYFGDSYIEGDILLADLREDLQNKYGGYGVGWLDAGNDINQYKHTTTNKFSGIVEHMVKRPDSYDVTKAGIAERYYTLSGPAQISLAPFVLHEYKRTDIWSSTKLYLRPTAGANVTINIDGGKQQIIAVSPSTDIQIAELAGKTSNALIKISSSNATLFGTAQEAEEGVVVDNFSMRGSDGQSLAKLPEAMLKRFAAIRPYDLIVFQFGVNAVDANTTPERLQKYIKGMGKAIELFKRAFPNTSILIMGAPDRGSKASPNGTMKGIEELERYQMKLAQECKVGFYSLFNAMGGAGSMLRLVDEQGMGTKDYVHINYKGGKYISERIFKSIVAGQGNYARRKKMIEEH